MGENHEKELQTEWRTTGRRQDIIQRYVLNNIGIKLLAIIAAVVVWVAIVNIEDPYKERTFMVDVETVNEDAIASVNKVYEVIEGSTAQVRVKGKKSVVDRLRAEDIRATADLSDLSAVNAVAIVPELKKNVSDEPVLECNTVLKVSLEDRASKQVKVNVETTGTPQDGYSVGECMASPNMIEVTGGEGVIEKIDSVGVSVNVNGIGEDFKKKVTPVAYDADGKEVTSSTLQFGVNRIRVRVHVLKTKTIPVNIRITGTPADGYEFVSTECQPETIQVAGSRKQLERLSEVTVPIDISGMKSASGSVEQNISIQDYLPDGISVQEEYAQVSLRIGIEKRMSKTVSVSVEDIKFASLGDQYTARIAGSRSSIKLTIEGLPSVLDEMDISDYTAYVDCEGRKPGRYRLKVHLDLGDSSMIVKDAYITVQISKGKSDTAQEEPSQEEDSPTPEPTESGQPQE